MLHSPADPPTFRIGDRLTIEIETLGEHGEGVSVLGGLLLFVPAALPGELVEVRLVRITPTYRSAELLHILRPSVHRVVPPCGYFPRCGGCQIQHLDLDGQLLWKQRRVERALVAQSILSPVEAVVPSPESWGYRCKMLMPVQGTSMGLYAAHSHTLIALDRCLVHVPAGEAARAAVQTWLSAAGPQPGLRHVLLRTSSMSDQVLVCLVISHLDLSYWQQQAAKIAALSPAIVGIVGNLQPEATNTVLGRETLPLWGASTLADELCGIPVELSATSFFQVNPPQAEAIARSVLEWADQRPGSRLCDAFCGAGALALALTQHGHQVTGIELVPSAIEDAQRSAERLGLSAQFVCAKAEDWLAHSRQGDWDGLLLNPPRKGCAPGLIEQILTILPERLCMIFCDPNSMARDVAKLQSAYRIEQVRPFDLFPQTTHVETLVTLQLAESC
jgi:23S rRNA (uracil1939-C5)-methyltransferase